MCDRNIFNLHKIFVCFFLLVVQVARDSMQTVVHKSGEKKPHSQSPSCEDRTTDSSAKKVIKVENQSVDDNESKDQRDAQSTDEVI